MNAILFAQMVMVMLRKWKDIDQLETHCCDKAAVWERLGIELLDLGQLRNLVMGMIEAGQIDAQGGTFRVTDKGIQAVKENCLIRFIGSFLEHLNTSPST